MKRVYQYDKEQGKVVEVTVGNSAARSPAVSVRKYEQIVGWTQPTLKQVKDQGLARAANYDSAGRPVFNSRREIVEYQARVNDNPRNPNKIEWSHD